MLLSMLAAANPVIHVTDKPFYGWFVSNVTLMLILSGILTCLMLIPAAKRIATGKRGSVDDFRSQGVFANMIETVCMYLRDQTFRPILKEETDKYIGVLWSFFFFILIANLLGLVPLLDLTNALGMMAGGQSLMTNLNETASSIDATLRTSLGGALPDFLVTMLLGSPIKDPKWHGIGGTATQSIWVTGSLATIAFLFINGTAFIKDPVGFLKHLTAGAPFYMWPIMIPVEIMGMFVKPVALALRLFANMTGGHIIVATLFLFVVQLSTQLGGVLGHGLGLLPLLGNMVIYLLEILVAFIQAFIFTFLTGLFLAQLVVHEHDHDEHDGHHELSEEGVPLDGAHAPAMH